eukprot:CAMPEP_0204474216 /NCGR_PEP_ID=MMETSP0471-20130131/25264_1 /ASSEMBLY_ACC=CAM_ASM_000602 /TAXON_ID=2969 /ORGANISM="Oxyrrhis marina" /LENGTH=180 /DNA_ID=CAMNT_0051476575 /DNA_START=49 /DNA_END=590 /DNA_ORIENTATION=+
MQLVVRNTFIHFVNESRAARRAASTPGRTSDQCGQLSIGQQATEKDTMAAAAARTASASFSAEGSEDSPTASEVVTRPGDEDHANQVSTADSTVAVAEDQRRFAVAAGAVGGTATAAAAASVVAQLMGGQDQALLDCSQSGGGSQATFCLLAPPVGTAIPVHVVNVPGFTYVPECAMKKK